MGRFRQRVEEFFQGSRSLFRRLRKNKVSPTNSFEVELIGVTPVTDGQKIEEVSKKTGKKQMVNILFDEENVQMFDKTTGGIILQNTRDMITSVCHNEDTPKRLGYVFQTVNGEEHLVDLKTKKKTYPHLLKAILQLHQDGERKQELAELRRKNEALERELEEASKEASCYLALSDEQQRKMEELNEERKNELAELRRKNEALDRELQGARKEATSHLARLDEQQRKMEELDGRRRHELAVLCRKIEELGRELEEARKQASSHLAKTNISKETNPTPSDKVRGRRVTFAKTITVHIIEPEDWEKKRNRNKGKSHRT